MTENTDTRGSLDEFIHQGQQEVQEVKEDSPAPPDPSQPVPDSKEHLSDLTRRYIIRQEDIGKGLADMIDEVEGRGIQPLGDDELQYLEDVINVGYARKEIPLGPKATAELQTGPPSLMLGADELVFSYTKKHQITRMGGARLSNVHLVAAYLFRSGLVYPSYPRSQQPVGPQLDPNSLREHFETPAGLENRVEFCMNLDANIVDHFANQLRIFQAKVSRALSHAGIGDF